MQFKYPMLSKSSNNLNWLFVLSGILLIPILTFLLSVYRGDIGLWLIVAGAAGLIVFLNPAIGLYILIFSIPLENIFIFSGQVTWVRILGIVVFGAWIVRKLILKESWSLISGTSILKPALVLILLAFVSSLWARVPAVIPGAVFTLVQLLALSLLTFDLISSSGRIRQGLFFAVLGGIAASGLTLWQYYIGGFLRAGSNVSGNVNDTAKILVLLLPISFYVIRTENSWLKRSLGILYAIVSSWAVLVTFSRTAYLFLVFVLILQIWDLIRSTKRNLVYLLVIAGIAAFVLFQYVPWQDVQLRAGSIQPYLTGSGLAEGGLGGSIPARVHHWLVALAIFLDHPVLGVGYENFGYYFLKYQFDVPLKWFSGIYHSIRSPHSTMLGLLAELGIPGGIGLAFLFVAAFRNLQGSWGFSRRLDKALFARILSYSLLCYLLVSAVEATHTDKLLWFFLGLTEVVRPLRAR